MKKYDSKKRKETVPKLDIFGLINQAEKTRRGTNAVWAAFVALLVLRQRAMAMGGRERVTTPSPNQLHARGEWKGRETGR